MKRAIGLIAATLLTASVYSQDYSSSSSSTSNPDSTPDYRSRQTESGAPASSESGVSGGYDRAPGLSGGNSSTGQSNGSNIGGSVNDQSLTTRDSDVSGEEYRGTLQSEPDRSFNSELNGNSSSSSSQNSASGSPGESVTGSASSNDETTVKGSGTADGAFHQPAAPVREGSQSEGWSGSGTFSGAGPGSVNGSASSSDSSASSDLNRSTDNSETFQSDVSGNAALDKRDSDLRDRGLAPDRDEMSRNEDMDRQSSDNDGDVYIIEEWQVLRPQSDVGGPAENESGSSSSGSEQHGLSGDQYDRFDSSSSGGPGASVSGSGSLSHENDSYGQDLYRRMQKDWSEQLNTDVPAAATPSAMDHTVHDVKRAETQGNFYNDRSQSDLGGAGASVSGSSSSSSDEKGYHINRGEDEKYHINRDGSDVHGQTSAPGEYGDRPTKDNYDDGHLNGNNASGNSGSFDSSSSAGDISRPDSQKSSPGRPTGGDENSATTPE